MGSQGEGSGPRRGTTQLLVEAASGGDSGAQGRLLSRFEPLLRSCIESRLGRNRFRTEGDDVLQEVRLAVLKGLPALQGRDRASLVAWLRCVAENRVKDWLRREHARGRRLPGVPMPPATNGHEPLDRNESPSREILHREELEMLIAAINRVPERYRKVLQIVFRETLELEELAAIFGRSADASRKLLERAFKALRKALRERPR